MSLLERLGRGHLNERGIARVWASGEGDPHLDTCGACRARYDAFEQWVDGLAGDVRADAENALPADRYALQQVQIARRLEMLDRPGRIIAFPKAARTVIGGHTHVGRWAAAAAAAGLIAGVSLGQMVPGLFGRPDHLRQPIHAELTASQASMRGKSIKATPVSFDETQLLSDQFVDSKAKDLRAIDDMTPHVRDIVVK